MLAGVCYTEHFVMNLNNLQRKQSKPICWTIGQRWKHSLLKKDYDTEQYISISMPYSCRCRVEVIRDTKIYLKNVDFVLFVSAVYIANPMFYLHCQAE